jgi:hypothetical protein
MNIISINFKKFNWGGYTNELHNSHLIQIQKKRFILKKSVLLTTLLLGSFLGGNVYADELKKSCVKDNPLVAGESDPTLIGIYTQVCDKKNKDNKNAYLVQAAQQFQKLGRNLKALQLVNELNSSGINHTSLTDVKFLASVGIADQAVNQIRNQEGRYLNDDSYALAVGLNDAVKNAKPLSVIETKVEQQPKRVNTQQNTNRTSTTSQRRTTSTRNTSTRTTQPPRETRQVSNSNTGSTNSGATRSNPFDPLKR